MGALVTLVVLAVVCGVFVLAKNGAPGSLVSTTTAAYLAARQGGKSPAEACLATQEGTPPEKAIQVVILFVVNVDKFQPQTEAALLNCWLTALLPSAYPVPDPVVIRRYAVAVAAQLEEHAARLSAPVDHVLVREQAGRHMFRVA